MAGQPEISTAARNPRGIVAAVVAGRGRGSAGGLGVLRVCGSAFPSPTGVCSLCHCALRLAPWAESLLPCEGWTAESGCPYKRSLTLAVARLRVVTILSVTSGISNLILRML